MTIQCRCTARIKVDRTYTRKNGQVCHITSRTCDARKSLARHPNQYERQPKCPRCGARNWRVDRYRIRKELPRQEKCYCSGYPQMAANGIPHRKGSRQCDHHPLNADRY